MHKFSDLMKYKLVFSLIIFFVILKVSGQNPAQTVHHKAKINITGRNINDLTLAGIETDHGVFIKNRSFTSDFSEQELDLIKNLGFDFTILIRDVSSFYSNPERQSEINQGQLQLRSKCYGLSVPEYNYKTPD